MHRIDLATWRHTFARGAYKSSVGDVQCVCVCVCVRVRVRVRMRVRINILP